MKDFFFPLKKRELFFLMSGKFHLLQASIFRVFLVCLDFLNYWIRTFFEYTVCANSVYTYIFCLERYGDIPTMPQFSSLSTMGNSFVESNNANVAGHFGGDFH